MVSLPRRFVGRPATQHTNTSDSHIQYSRPLGYTPWSSAAEESVSRERRQCRSRALCQSDACICARGTICMPQTYTPPLGAIATPSASWLPRPISYLSGRAFLWRTRRAPDEGGIKIGCSDKRMCPGCEWVLLYAVCCSDKLESFLTHALMTDCGRRNLTCIALFECENAMYFSLLFFQYSFTQVWEFIVLKNKDELL